MEDRITPDPEDDSLILPEINDGTKMEEFDITEMGKILYLQGLYWTKSDGESLSDSASSRSSFDSFMTAVSTQDQLLLSTGGNHEKSKSGEEDKKSKISTNADIEIERTIFIGRGLASPDLPQPATPSRRVSRKMPKSPSTGLIYQSPSTPSPDAPSRSGYRNAYRRLTFDRVMDLSAIRDRVLDSPKFEFTENGDIASPLPSSSPFKSSTWEPKLSTPKKELSTRQLPPGSNGDFMSKTGGLGLDISAHWIL